MNINLHIERLILDGLPFGSDRAATIEAAVSSELARLFADGAVPAGLRSSVAVPALRGEPVAAVSTGNANRLGTAIAQSVHGAISK